MFFGGKLFYSELLHMNKQARGSVYSTSGQKLLTCFAYCRMLLFVDLLVALSVMKQTLWRGLVSVSISGGVASGQ